VELWIGWAPTQPVVARKRFAQMRACVPSDCVHTAKPLPLPSSATDGSNALPASSFSILDGAPMLCAVYFAAQMSECESSVCSQTMIPRPIASAANRGALGTPESAMASLPGSGDQPSPAR
jgi:hypothetical protein